MLVCLKILPFPQNVLDTRYYVKALYVSDIQYTQAKQKTMQDFIKSA